MSSTRTGTVPFPMLPWWSYTCSITRRLPRGSHASVPHPDVECGLVELGLEVGDGAERLLDGIGQLAVGLTPAVRAHVAPEERVQHVPGEVEGEGLLQLVDGGEVAPLPSLGELLEGRVRAGDVGSVVLVVM